jgi:hypothetical protein
MLRDSASIRRAMKVLGVDDSAPAVEACVAAGAFKALSGGRAPGQEDRGNFFRKGVAGDWTNHFRDEDRRIFNEEAGRALVELGYEANERW